MIKVICTIFGIDLSLGLFYNMTHYLSKKDKRD